MKKFIVRENSTSKYCVVKYHRYITNMSSNKESVHLLLFAISQFVEQRNGLVRNIHLVNLVFDSTASLKKDEKQQLHCQLEPKYIPLESGLETVGHSIRAKQ